jgi:hypothetical protein
VWRSRINQDPEGLEEAELTMTGGVWRSRINQDPKGFEETE